MVFKSCAYKGCENYVMDNMDCGKRSFTLFRFPKEPRRRQLWMELGQVSSKIPSHHLHMCSEHFDSKFISVNSRCTLLIGQAVPNAYEDARTIDNACTNEADSAMMETSAVLYDDEEVEEDEEAEEVEITETLEEFEDDMDEFQVESTTMRNEYSIHKTVRQDSPDNETLFNVGLLDTCTGDYVESASIGILEKVALASQAKKRQAPAQAATPALTTDRQAITSNAVSATSAKQKKIIPPTKGEDVRSSSVNGVETALKGGDSQMGRDSTAGHSELESNHHNHDASVVTTFIFRDEEYVQMPKDYYLREKMQLTRKVAHYEKVLRNFKQQLDAVNFGD